MTRLTWADQASRWVQSGIDRGVFYTPGQELQGSSVPYAPDSGQPRKVSFDPPLDYPLAVGSTVVIVQNNDPSRRKTGRVLYCTSTQMGYEITFSEGANLGLMAAVTVTGSPLGVAWTGLISFDEDGGDSLIPYFIDGQPFYYHAKPKIFAGALKAYTYPDEFERVLGYAEATDGLILDSQLGSSFHFSYRTLIANGIYGNEAGYRIHLIYNATVPMSDANYATLSNDLSPVEFTFPINAVPETIEGYHPTAHIIVDSRRLNPTALIQLEEMLYGTEDAAPTMPSPQTVYELMSIGDDIIITNLSAGFWSAEGSTEHVYMDGPDVFVVDGADLVDNGDGTYDISSVTS